MPRIMIRVRGNDRYRGKKGDKYNGETLVDVLLKLFREKKVSGATVFRGVHGYGARGIATMKVLGLSLDLPVLIETVDESSKLEPLLPEIKRIVGDNGLITLEDIDVI
jgi:hypothetical protein